MYDCKLFPIQILFQVFDLKMQGNIVHNTTFMNVQHACVCVCFVPYMLVAACPCHSAEPHSRSYWSGSPGSSVCLGLAADWNTKQDRNTSNRFMIRSCTLSCSVRRSPVGKSRLHIGFVLICQCCVKAIVRRVLDKDTDRAVVYFISVCPCFLKS